MEHIFFGVLEELARIFQAPALWQIVADLVVPLAAAAAAAIVVIRQVRQLDRHREADRHAGAVIELCEMLTAHSKLMISAIDARENGENGPTQLDRFLFNPYLVRAQAGLPGDNIAIALWTAQRCEDIIDETRRLMQTGPTSNPGTVGPARTRAMRITTDATTTLLQWQRGDIPTSWFEEQLNEAGYDTPRRPGRT